jgi:hypothetical protein
MGFWVVLFSAAAMAMPVWAVEKAGVADTPPFGAPDEGAVARSMKLIRQTFEREYAGATSVAARAALAQRLLKEAVETKEDKPTRYALLCEARDLAAKGADAATACRAIDLLAAQFGVTPGEMTVAALSGVARIALTPQSQEALARAALAAADQAVARDEYELAGRLAAVGEAAAAKLQRVVLLTAAQEKVREVNWAATEHRQAKAAIETLAVKPDDADAKAAVGRFKCLVKNDWEQGLPLLAEGSDRELKLLAERDQAAASAGPAVQYEVAEQWWELGNRHVQRARLACRGRAAYWYARCAAKLSGFPKTTAERRMEDLDLARLREMHLGPGLAAEVFGGQQFAKPLAKQVDAQLDFEWEGAAGTGLPRDDFSIRWTGFLRAPAAGKYTFVFHVNQAGRVWIDGQLVLDQPDGQNKRKGVNATVQLAEGMHPIKVEFSDGGGLAKCRLLWQPPGAVAEEPVPARAFVHELGR